MNILKAVAVWVWDVAGDARTKNRLLLILAAMTLFGIVSPERATALRDSILALLV